MDEKWTVGDLIAKLQTLVEFDPDVAEMTIAFDGRHQYEAWDGRITCLRGTEVLLGYDTNN